MSQTPSPDFFEDELNYLVQQELRHLWQEVPPREVPVVERQRTAFIEAGVRLAQQAKWVRMKLVSRTALRYAAIICFTFLSTFIGARVATAESLPGDRLYPVKLSLESVDSLFYEQEAWETQQEARRLQEVFTIAIRGESAIVNFVATPIESDGDWYVGATPLIVTNEQNQRLHNQCDGQETNVRVFGHISNGKIYAQAITPNCFFIASR